MNTAAVIPILFSLHFWLGSLLAIASGNTQDRPKKFVAVIEHSFHQSVLNSPSIIQPNKLPSLCRKFTQFYKGTSYNRYATHGLKVVQNFHRVNPKLHVVPLSLFVSDNETISQTTSRFISVFDCLELLNSTKMLAGVNFSAAAFEIIRSKLSEREEKIFQSLDAFGFDLISNFSKQNPNVIISLAVGNDQKRLESIYAFPMTSVCNSKIRLTNLFCITRYMKFVGKGTKKEPARIWGRYSESPNIVSFGLDGKISTSLLSSQFLAYYLDNRVTFSKAYVEVPSLNQDDTDTPKTVEIKTVSAVH